MMLKKISIFVCIPDTFFMANTIDEVITQLTEIVDRAQVESNRIGFFAALYCRVTVGVKEGIAQGRFQNPAQMEVLDVLFANRFLEAYEQHQRGEPTTASWAKAFKAAARKRPLILQHLLLGINAHINLDLGIAAQQTCTGEKLASLQADFEMINTILAELVQPVENTLVSVSPWIGLIDKVNPKVDDCIMNFSMNIARNCAWKFAVDLNSLNASEQPTAIKRRDQEIAHFARKVVRPKGILMNIGLFVIGLRESNDVTEIISVLR